jgi:outer membrane protein
VKKILVIISALFVFAGSALAAGGKTAYVDTQVVFEKTKLGKKYQGIIREYYDSRKKILDMDYEELQKLQEDYKKQSSVMNEKARKEKEEAISRKINEFEKKRADFSNEIDKKREDLSRDFNQVLTGVLKDVAKKEKSSLILNKSIDIMGKTEVPSVLYADEELDLTEKVVVEMDKKQETTETK